MDTGRAVSRATDALAISAIRLIAEIGTVCLFLSGCGSAVVEPAPCGGRTLLAHDPRRAQPVQTVPPDSRDLQCYLDGYRERACAEMPFTLLPDGAPTWSVPPREMCWVVFQREASPCLKNDLREAVYECDVPDLRALIPWHGRCDAFGVELERIVSGLGDDAALVSPETARVLSFLANAGFLELSSGPEMLLEQRAHEIAEPSPGELRRLHLIQSCMPAAVDPFLGAIWIRGWEDRRQAH